MKALITGAYGFVGKHLAHELLSGDIAVVATGRHVTASTSVISSFPSAVEHSQLDTLDPESIRSALKEHAPDVIYHLAGISFVPQSEKDFPASLSSNVGGLHNLLNTCLEVSPKTRCIVVSSAEVYRTPSSSNELPLKENHPLHPRNKYGVTRICGEKVAAYFEDKLEAGVVVVRPFTHIGVGQEEKFVVASFAKQIAEIQLGKREPKIFVGNLDVERDFSDVADVVRAYRTLATRGDGIYNLGSGAATKVRSLLMSLIEIAGLQRSVTIEIDPTRVRPNEMPQFYGDCSRAKEDLDWQASIPLRSTLEAMYYEWLSKTKNA